MNEKLDTLMANVSILMKHNGCEPVHQEHVTNTETMKTTPERTTDKNNTRRDTMTITDDVPTKQTRSHATSASVVSALLRFFNLWVLVAPVCVCELMPIMLYVGQQLVPGRDWKASAEDLFRRYVMSLID